MNYTDDLIISTVIFSFLFTKYKISESHLLLEEIRIKCKFLYAKKWWFPASRSVLYGDGKYTALDFFKFYFLCNFRCSAMKRRVIIFFTVREKFGESGGCQQFSETHRVLWLFQKLTNFASVRKLVQLQRNPETATTGACGARVTLFSRNVTADTLSIFARKSFREGI